MFNRLKLMPKMVTLFLLIVLIPMLVALVVSFSLAEQALTEAIETEIKIFHGQQQRYLETWFAFQKNVAEAAAATQDVYDSLNYYVDDPWATENELFMWENRNRLILTPFLESIVERYDFAYVMVANRKGIVVSATNRNRLRDDLSGREYFQKALLGQTNISEIFYSDLLAENCLVIATPIYSNGEASGTVNGVMIFLLNVPRISKILTDGLDVIGKSADAYLVDANQILLTVPRFQQGMAVLRTKIATEAAAEAARAIAAGNRDFQQFFVYNDLQGKKVIGNASTLTFGEQLVGLNVKVDYDEAFAAVNKLRDFALFLAVVSCAIVVMIGFTFARSLARPILGFHEKLKQLAAGDFTVKLATDRRDEIGEMAVQLNMTAKALRESFINVVRSSESVQMVSAQIAAGNQDLSQRTQEQASSLEEISSTIEEVTSSIRSVSNNAEQANHVAQITLEAVNEGEHSIVETINAMAEISNSSKQIAEIIKVVNDIAFQTNLLALNAAVEAARAGEQGRGFAVVAAEVRNLAGRTAESAKEIEELISESVRRVDRGNELIQKSFEMLQRIVENTKKTSDMVVEVAAAMREQAGAAEQIQASIEQLNQVTQENAAMVEEISATSQALDAEAAKLRENVARFKVDDRLLSAQRTEETKSPKGTLGQENGVKKPRPVNGNGAVNFVHDSLDRF
ncbi:MAG TPA: HAMP domain-containing protein [Firmicutes bacterium]|nr:HAMP domain-containing protein [Bacillota bacterium]